MATENTAQSVAAPAPVATSVPAPSAIKPASSKTGLIVVAVIIGILVLAGIGVGGYFLVTKVLMGEDSPLKNLGKSEEEIAADALTAGANNIGEAMTSDSEETELDAVTDSMPSFVQGYLSGYSVSGVPSTDQLFTSDEEGLQSFVMNYEIALDSSADTLNTDLAGKYTQSDDNMELTANATGTIDLTGTEIALEGDLTMRMVGNDS